VYADVTIGEAAMAGVDAALVLQALDGQFGEYVTVPGPEALEDGEYDERFDVFVADADPGSSPRGLARSRRSSRSRRASSKMAKMAKMSNMANMAKMAKMAKMATQSTTAPKRL